jgi:hypothetical protein
MQFDQLKRREFITLLGGAAAWPLAARAQRIKNARIGFLGLVSPSSHAARLAALRAGLRDLGWVEGRKSMCLSPTPLRVPSRPRRLPPQYQSSSSQ